MDALKFALEILIVGALALPWIAILIWMFSPRSQGESDKPVNILHLFLSVVPDDTRGAVAAVLIIAIGYLLGSSLSRISRSFFDDELLGRVPTEKQIREDLYWDEYCMGKLLGDLALPEKFGPTPGTSTAEGLCNPQNTTEVAVSPSPPRRRMFRFSTSTNRSDRPAGFGGRVQELFFLQEGDLLLNGEDKVERLKEYYDQITVLRGGALNGFILCALCLFGFCGNYRERWSRHRILSLVTFVPAGALTLYGFISILSHWNDKGLGALGAYRDPPLAEAVLLLLGVIGVFVTLKAAHATYYGPMCVVAAVLGFVAFGGWWWTEVMYDIHVIHAVPDLLPKRSGRAAQIER